MRARPCGPYGRPSHQPSALCSQCFNVNPIASGAVHGLGRSHVSEDVLGQQLFQQTWMGICCGSDGSPSRHCHHTPTGRRVLEKVRRSPTSHILALPPALTWMSSLKSCASEKVTFLIGFWLKIPMFLFLSQKVRSFQAQQMPPQTVKSSGGTFLPGCLYTWPLNMLTRRWPRQRCHPGHGDGCAQVSMS